MTPPFFMFIKNKFGYIKLMSFLCISNLFDMDTFVNISSTFFVENRLVTVSTCCESRKMHLFVYCFRQFFKRMGWISFNEDLPLSFEFSFSSMPDRFVNIVNFTGIKPNMSIIVFCKYMNNVLSKSK